MPHFWFEWWTNVRVEHGRIHWDVLTGQKMKHVKKPSVVQFFEAIQPIARGTSQNLPKSLSAIVRRYGPPTAHAGAEWGGFFSRDPNGGSVSFSDLSACLSLLNFVKYLVDSTASSALIDDSAWTAVVESNGEVGRSYFGKRPTTARQGKMTQQFLDRLFKASDCKMELYYNIARKSAMATLAVSRNAPMLGLAAMGLTTALTRPDTAPCKNYIECGNSFTKSKSAGRRRVYCAECSARGIRVRDLRQRQKKTKQ